MEEDEYLYIKKNIGTIPHYQLYGGILYRIENEKKLRVIQRHKFEGLMYIMHDHAISAHFGLQTTSDKIKEKYYWKGMKKDIEAYVKSCDKCQRRQKPQGKHELHPIKVEEPFARIGIDIVGPLPITQRGNRYIVVAMDYFTKWPKARVLREAIMKKVSNFKYRYNL